MSFITFWGSRSARAALYTAPRNVRPAIRSGRVKLLILDAVLSDSTKRNFVSMCGSRGIETIEVPDQDRLGRSIGKENIKIIGVTDSGFSVNILKKFKEVPDRSGN